MRITYLSRRTWPSRGGIESFLRRLYRHMAARHDVVVVAQRIDSGRNRPVRDAVQLGPFEPFADGPVRVCPFALPWPRRLAVAPLVLQASQRLRRSEHGRAQELMGMAFARIAAPALVRTIARTDLIHVMGGYEIAGAGVQAGAILGVPVVVSPFAHPGHWDDDAASAWAYRRATRVLATLDADAATYRSLGVHDGRLQVIGLFCDLPPRRLEPDGLRARHGIDGDLVVFVGGRYPHKGVDVLLSAAEHVRRHRAGATFAFVGPGPPLVLPEAPRVIDVGIVEDHERWEWLAAADILCLPSEAETFGLVVLEAWATSTAVVTSDIPALAELVQRGGGGLAVPRSPAVVGEALVTLLSDPGRLRGLAESGHRYWHEHGRPEVVVGRYEALYENVLSAFGG